MIPHHEGAIAMAQAQLRYGRNEQLRRLAQEIIVSQSQEIAAMRLAIEEAATPAAALPAPPRSTTGHSWGRRLVVTRGGFVCVVSVFVVLTAAQSSSAGQAPGVLSAPDVAISGRDRVYAAEQFSNTVSVTDPSTNALLGVIRLGDLAPGNLSPLYRGQLLLHGMGFSPDHRTLAVVSIGSNSVTFIDTTTNAVKRVTYVGRSPHEVFSRRTARRSGSRCGARTMSPSSMV